MVKIDSVSMKFPLPKRYREYFLSTKKTKHFKALDDVTLNIDEGDRVAFLGVNGAGKTTLLKLIGGLLYPSSGSIEVNGYDTTSNNSKSRKNVGFVLNEERSFYWRLTAVQNLEFFGVLDNLKGLDLTNRINKLIELVGLDLAKFKEVASYSSGMKQRLAMARGLLCDPKILILDEPTRALDPQAVQDMKNLISRKIHEDKQRTLLIATHRFDEVEELCNKVCVMQDGKLISYNSINEIRSHYKSVEQYYHEKMNIRITN